MIPTTSPDWNKENTSGLVSIGTHSLFVSTHGITRTSSTQPVILIICGTAGTLARWPALIRALEPHYRILGHERSGMGRSEPSPDSSPPSMDTIASNLHTLLKATNIHPPYILLAHSWGGMLATYFASTFLEPQSAIKGLILLDSGAPTQNPSQHHTDFTTDPGSPWSHPCIVSIAKYTDVLDIMLPAPSKSSLTPAEHAYLKSQTSPSTPLEFLALQASYTPFLEKSFFNRNPSFLSGTPIATVHAHAHTAFQTLHDEAVKYGWSSESDRADLQRLLKTWKEDVRWNQEQFLTLTEEENRKQIIGKEGTGHDVMMMDVEACAEGVRWVVEEGRESER